MGMTKYRVVKQGDSYYVQYRFFFWWVGHSELDFTSEKAAHNFVLALLENEKTKKAKIEVIKEY